MSAYGNDYNRACGCMRCKMRGMMWPAIMVTMGTMWLLSELQVLHHHQLFIAVLFIVIGAVKLLQSSASDQGHIAPPMPAMPPPPPPMSPAGTSGSGEVHHG